MKVVDFHTHFFPDELAPKAISAVVAGAPGTHACTDGTRGGLIRSMSLNGISLSVTLPVATRQSQVTPINEAAARSSADTAIIAFGTLHPKKDNSPDDIAFLQSSGIRGIKLHPEYQDFFVDDSSLFPLYEALSNAGLITVFHAGMDPGPFNCNHAHPSALLKVHKTFPRLKMVAAHMGGWKLWDEAEHILCGHAIYLDTSAVAGLLPPKQFRRMMCKHGADNILFGSDSPWFDQGVARQWVEQACMDSKSGEKILSQNAFDLLVA